MLKDRVEDGEVKG